MARKTKVVKPGRGGLEAFLAHASRPAGTMLPVDCGFRAELLANFAPDAPISQWCHGFIAGHDWLSDTWDAYVPDDDDQLGPLVMVSSFFATATTIRELFPDALAEYARLGRLISHVVADYEANESRRTKARPSRRPRQPRRQ